MTIDEIYSQDPNLFNHHGLLNYLFLEEDDSEISVQLSDSEDNILDTKDSPTIRAIFNNCTFIDGI